MRGLRKLEWNTFEYDDNGVLGRSFEEEGLKMPSVKELEVSQGASFLVRFCENVEVLTGGEAFWRYYSWKMREDPRVRLFEAAKGTKVKTLTLKTEWDPDLIDGSLSTQYKWTPDQRGWPREDGSALKLLVEHLKRFPNLKNLQLPYAYSLLLGWDGGPWCGNAYDGPDGKELARWVREEDEMYNERAGRIVMEILEGLETLSVGEETPIFNRN
ncbi:hypothetical protein AA313_de0201260 [Arthrobotrys entomopaga]|nr:hypothetical protein AA313_de0201260 [Arthrobotrys entomopaga]